ncbi:MAG TPA: GGDEF domain-containing protein [Solirubrobacterales bacterium]|nr:GGDEF domain-containing protein [Solirubrobacterales bacterium]
MVTTKNAHERARRASAPIRLIAYVRGLPAPVWAMAMIYGLGGSMCILAAAFPISPTTPVELARALGVVLLVGSFLLLRFGPSLPPVGLQAAVVAGTLAHSVLVANCTTDYGATLNSLAYLWIAIYAGQFFSRGEVRLQCAVIVVASGTALELSGLPGMGIAWVSVAGSSVVAGEILARLNGRLRTQLITDPLTGLLNRAGFVAAAERIFGLADRGGMPVCVALIDLDGFKQVNDLQGHAAGDGLLAELGEAWGEEMRGSEVLARLGGDEFALVLAGSGRAGADDALHRLRAVSPVDWSVGVVEWPRGESLDRAMARADEELYRAKRDSRVLREAAKVPPCEPLARRSFSSLPSV